MKIKNKLAVICLVASTFQVKAQSEPSYSLSLENNVKDLVVVPQTGVVVISEGDFLRGFTPEKGEFLWSTQVKSKNMLSTLKGMNKDAAMNMMSSLNPNAKAGAISIISGTPYIKYFDDNNNMSVLNSVNGEVLYSKASAAEGVTYYDSEYIYGEDALLLKGFKKIELNDKAEAAADAIKAALPENFTVALYGLKDQAQIWETDIKTNVFRGLGAAMDMSAVDKVEKAGENVVILEKRSVFVLELANGNLLWKDDENKYSTFYKSLKGDRILLEDVKGLLGTKSELTFKNALTGEDLWPEKIKTKRLITYEDWSTKMLLAHRKGFNFFDYETGEKIWKKDPKGKNVKKVISTGKDFLYVYDDEVMLLDQDGQKKWKKDVKISDKDDEEVHFLETTPSGKVLYVTSSRANMINYETGKKLWKGNLGLNDKRPSFTTYNKKSNTFVLFNDEKFYKFDDESDDKPKTLVKLKLKNEKLITSIDVFDNSISVTGSTDVAGIDFDGNIIYANRYTQPGELGRAGMKAGLKMVGVGGKGVGGASVTVTVTYRDENGNEVSQSSTAGIGSKNTRAAADLIGDASNALAQNFTKRFDALQQDDKYALIFSKGEAGEKYIIKVNKETGVEENKIEVVSNKPIYDYDGPTGNLYYSRKNEIHVYLGK